MHRTNIGTLVYWRDSVPDLVAVCADRWRLTIGELLPGGYFGQAFACADQDRRALILKLSPPAAQPALEAAALRLWGGNGAVRLHDWDPAAGALLLDRIAPGTPLPTNSVDMPPATRSAENRRHPGQGIGQNDVPVSSCSQFDPLPPPPELKR